ncbi:PpiC-type peptidyl-prolyl cis-trans isomerase [Leptothrix cholodnii SP-6]|uniref:Periplasmic chaperone PpiD n=1 Tax=Leptothrix cholodnii (strain ATCC 51168 / LMG 8142 / SP-6) TaxID=395495 RepID=B1Y0T7_LEPCP|nr:SurA N-terminal domain-containing protein [Leptothrix cholodnii]ACB34195.1 PpiC-type peptidyl-prolyl cis-trans isomerase [Leptothrix cholodnii SP-6]
MFDFVRRHNRLLQFGLALVIVPSFLVVGIQGYDQFSASNEAVANIDGRAITQTEWDAAHRQQVERVRAQMPGVDAKLLDSPAIKQKVLDDLVRERVMLVAAQKLLLAPTDQRLQRLFATDPQFASLRNADGSVRKDLLEARGMTSEQFAQQLRQEFALRQVSLGLAGSALASPAVTARAMDSFFQQREVQVALFPAKDYLSKVSASDAEQQAYYDDPRNAAQFQSPETVSVEYVVLDLPAVTAGINVNEDDLRKYYDENAARYEQPQERRARHILVKLDADASDDAKAKAREKAAALLAEVQKNRAAFADLARRQSDDPGSAAQGGDLDWIARGAMVKPFEDAVFGLKKGELGGIVETEFGLHVIEVTDTRGGEKRAFANVRGELEAEVRKQLAQKRYAELAEQFTNLVEQEDTLKPVADALKLELHKADKLGRVAPAQPGNVLASPKVLEAIFQPESLSGKRNIEPVEAAANQLVAARVLEHAPARKQPLAEVGERLRNAVISEKAAKAAADDGKTKLAEWQSKPESAKLGAALVLSRTQAQGQPREVVDAVLRAPADKLPGWIGVELGGQGYAVIKLAKVLAADPAATGDPERVKAQYAQLWSQAESDAYYRALSKRYKAEVTDKGKAAVGTATP